MGIRSEIELHTSSLVIANIHYFIKKVENHKKAIAKIEKLLQFIRVLSVSEKEIQEAIKSNFKDFEDAIQNFTALNSKVDVLVTRNIKDFKLSSLPILTPTEFLAKIETQ